MSRFLVVLLALSIVIAGCGKDPKQTGKAERVAPTADVHAASTVVPGSYEDWCGEHQVSESECTRCDPALVPAFKATNDWCDEHGLPESQCLACNPGLRIVRPPKSEEK